MVTCSEKDQCPTERILCEKQKIKFRKDNSLNKIFGEFIDKPFDTEPNYNAWRKMITHEPQFRKICQNLKLHLGSNVIETDIFKGIKAVAKRDFEKELKSEKIQIIVPQVFLSKFPQVYQYDEYITKVNELKVMQEINDLISKLERERRESDINWKKKLKQRLKEKQEKMRKHLFYTELRSLKDEEIQMVKSIHTVKAEKTEKRIFKAIKKYSKLFTMKELL